MNEKHALAKSLKRSRSDPAAFTPFYAGCARGLLTDLTRRVLIAEVAVDLMAETMAKAYVGRKRFRGSTDAEARAWLHAIGAREVALYYRRKRVETKTLHRLGLERPEPPDEAESLLIQKEALAELQSVLKTALGRLSPDQQDIVERRLIRDERYDSIAGHLGISEMAARARVSRALKALREAIDHDTLSKEIIHGTP